MKQYPVYPEYSQYGFPAFWKEKRLRFAIEMNPSKQESKIDASDLVSFVPMDAVGEYGGIRLDDEREMGEIGSGYTYFCDDDVVVAKITPCFENGKGALAKGLKNKTAFGTTELHVMRALSAQLLPEFLFYLTISHVFRKRGESEMYGAGGQKRVPETFIKDFEAALPSINEQKTIARFLDHKTAQIDALIAKKKALLDKLAEKRSALISCAVTKGLNPAAAMKDSGVAWLGKIPAHWGVRRLKFSVSQINQKVDAASINLPYIGLEHIESWTGKKLQGEISDSEGVASQYQAGDVLFGKLRPYLAKVHLAVDAGLVSSEALVLRPHTELHNELLKYYVLSKEFINIVDSSTFGSKMPRASWEFIGNLPILLPDLEEQHAIARFLDEKTAEIEQQAEKIRQAIEKLNEYRAALITHAVTGKIDVRGFDFSTTSKAPRN